MAAILLLCSDLLPCPHVDSHRNSKLHNYTLMYLCGRQACRILYVFDGCTRVFIVFYSYRGIQGPRSAGDWVWQVSSHTPRGLVQL